MCTWKRGISKSLSTPYVPYIKTKSFLTYTIIHDSVSKCFNAFQQFLAYSLTFKIFIHFSIRKKSFLVMSLICRTALTMTNKGWQGSILCPASLLLSTSLFPPDSLLTPKVRLQGVVVHVSLTKSMVKTAGMRRANNHQHWTSTPIPCSWENEPPVASMDNLFHFGFQPGKSRKKN